MTNALEQLKKRRASSIDKLAEQLDKIGGNKGSSREDNRYWKPTKDNSGNSFAIIRFLDAPQGEEDPIVKIYDTGFQGPTGQYYIENSLRTINKPDPAGELYFKYYNASKDPDSAERKMAQKLRSRTHFISNIQVIKDSGNSANEGKVFLYKYGKKIYDKLNSLLNPEFEDEKAINPFDLWEGANFRLKMRQVDGFPNYDKSEFDSISPIADDDDEITKIWTSCYSLQAEIAEDKFKSYEELKKRLNMVMGIASDETEEKREEKQETPSILNMTEEFTSSKQKETKVVEQVSEEVDADDDDLAFFAKLAKDS